MKSLIDKLRQQKSLSKEEFASIITSAGQDKELSEYLFSQARSVALEQYSNEIFIRGLIEFTNYCKNNCFYCGIRCGNKLADRYRLHQEAILSCCDAGYRLGFRTFVLQGGEDNYFTTEKMVALITAIKTKYPDCALTLSVGEKSYETYLAYYQAGADRYLLRHETANAEHYAHLHPKELSLENRKKCLLDLKNIGFQFGTGFMVGSPYQTVNHLAEDLCFIEQIQPHMVGIGPFIPHFDTPFKNQQSGSMEQTLIMIALLRLLLPKSLLPSSTALDTVDESGRQRGILAGANVVMPNLSPLDVREKYMLYEGKKTTGLEAAESIKSLEKSFQDIGYQLVYKRGDALK